jgi:hypothetical protein
MKGTREIADVVGFFERPASTYTRVPAGEE